MIRRNVMDESAIYFIVANAAMQPAEKHDKLNADGYEDSKKLRQIRRHMRVSRKLEISG
jgi:hypothetical protein